MATAVPRQELRAAVRALTGCQRCCFVEQVLSAFDPDPIAAPSNTTATAEGNMPGAESRIAPATPTPTPANGAATANLSGEGPSGHDSFRAARSGACSQGAAPAVAAPGAGIAAGVLAPAQLLALLSSSSNSNDVVSLLQFAWKDTGTTGPAAQGGPAGSGSGSGGASSTCVSSLLPLSDSLLGRPRLLRRFLVESRVAMQALAEEVGDCRRHGGYPGPAELASTLARLDCQRAHTLERLAAWGVLRPPPPPPPQHQQHQGSASAATPLPDSPLAAPEAQASPRHHARSPGFAALGEQTAGWEQIGGRVRAPRGATGGRRVRGAERGDLGTRSDQLEQPPRASIGDEGGTADDPGLALAIRLSLEEGTPDTAQSLAGGTCGPTAARDVAEGEGSCGVQKGAGPSEQRQLLGPRPQPSRSGTPAGAVSAGNGACGTRDGGTPPRGMCTWPGAVRSPGSIATQSPGPGRSPGAVALSGSLEGLAACGLVDDGSLPAPPPQDPSHPQPRPRPLPSPPRPAAASRPAAALPVCDAAAAGAGLPDACVLVDSAAVAALSEGLRERVEHLVSQLVQVQQRRGRLEHALQHGILAGGRRLLLLLLQLMWAALRRAMTEAVEAGVLDTEAGAEAEAEPREGASASGEEAGARRPEPGDEAGTAVAAAEGEAGRQPFTASAAPSPLPGRAPRPSPHPNASPQQRLPRYEGLLAELAEGLGEEDMYLDPCSGPSLLSGPGPGAELGLDGWPDAEEVRQGPQGPSGRDASESASRLGDLLSVGARESASVPWVLWPLRGSTVGNEQDADDGGDGDQGGWDAARSSGAGLPPRLPARGGLQASLPRGAGVAHGPAARPRQLAAPTAFPPSGEPAVAGPGLPPRLAGGAGEDEWAGPLPRWTLGHGGGAPGDSPGGGGAVGGAGGGCGGCRPECLAERVEQAEQLRVLQGQLARCQASQSELQGEVGRLLDTLGESRRAQEQAVQALQRELAQWRGESAALAGMGSEELGALASRLEGALSRVRAAQVQAAAEREQQCPVCWERRKGLVFGCGHQTCCACGEKLAQCPICRVPVSIRIRVYG